MLSTYSLYRLSAWESRGPLRNLAGFLCFPDWVALTQRAAFGAHLGSLRPCSGEPWNGLSQPVLSELPGLPPKSWPDSPWNRTPLIPEPGSWMHIPNFPIVSVFFFSPLSQKFGNWETQMTSRACIHPLSDKRVKGFLPGWGWRLLCTNWMKMTQRSQS